MAKGIVIAVLLGATGCPAPAALPPSPAPTSPPALVAAQQAPATASTVVPPVPQISLTPRHLTPPTPQADIARAKRLLEKGAALYRRGDYDDAEDNLKEAMTLYPFLADANLLLGKIFLIRGAAGLDRTLIDHARLMFEMAKKLDPSLHETDLLLELFAPSPTR